MKIFVRRSLDRGHANHGWLNSYHTFSFADYHDPRYMGFRSLRVINQDRVAAGGGFPAHPHRNMEIFSYVLEGQLEHHDSMGNGRTLSPGQIQLMSAGTGVTHSEFNPSKSAAARFLQIWITPRENGLTPSYTEWHPQPGCDEEKKVLVISADGRDDSALIHQDADIFRIRLKAGDTLNHTLANGRGLWLQLIHGKLLAHGETLQDGDAAHTETEGSFIVSAETDSEALLFDLG